MKVNQLILMLLLTTINGYGQFVFNGSQVGSGSNEASSVNYNNVFTNYNATNVQQILDSIVSWEWKINPISTNITFSDSNFVSNGKRVYNISDRTINITINNDINRNVTAVIQGTNVDSTITVTAGEGVTFLGNGTAPITAGFSLDSLNLANITPLGGGQYSVVGYFKPYSEPQYLDPPLYENPNPEIIDANSAHAFIPYETNAVLFEDAGFQPINVTTSSVADNSNNYGEYVMQLEAINGEWARTRHEILPDIVAGEVYQYVLLYRMLPNTQNSNASTHGEFRIGGSNGLLVQTTGLSATNWTELSGEFTPTSGNTYFQANVFAAHSGGVVGDVIQYKLSIKQKND